MITIKEVTTKKDIKEFINFPLKLYKGNTNFVPPLYSDEKAILTSNKVYANQAESIFFLAKENGKTVGRIQGILQKISNEKWKQKRVRFTRFDCLDNSEIANALFSAVEKWAKNKGMEEVVGPLGYSDLDREGLLIDGFNELSTFEEQYNYPYYQTLLENNGYKKEVDWVEYKLSAPKTIDERIENISNHMLRKYGLRLATAKNSREFVRKWGKEFFDVLDETYVAIYQSVPFTDEMKTDLINNFKLILNVKYATVILDSNDKIVGFGLAFPSIGKAIQKSQGKLTLPAIIGLLKAIKKPKVLDLALIGVVPEYKSKAIATAIISEMIKMLTVGGIEYVETNLNLEDNSNIRNQWKSFTAVQHKRRRSFVKRI